MATESGEPEFPRVVRAAHMSRRERVHQTMAGAAGLKVGLTEMLTDTSSLLGKVDSRFVNDENYHDLSSMEMARMYRLRMRDVEIKAASYLGSPNGSKTAVRLQGGPGPGGVEHSIVVDRQELLHLTSLQVAPWWTSIESEPVRKRLEKMHMHKYNCMNKHCGKLTTALLAMGQWECCTRFSLPVLDFVTGKAEHYIFYVRADHCPPMFKFGWVRRPVEILNHDVLEELPQGLRPTPKSLVEITAKGEDRTKGGHGFVRVKRMFEISRYDQDTVDFVARRSSMVKNRQDLAAQMREHFETKIIGDLDGLLLIPRADVPPAAE